MINRVLIRIKTVQLLYSYLLIEKPFSLESQPSSPTKEKRYAYSLYMDMVYLLYSLANKVSGKGNSFPLMETRFVEKLEQDDKIRSLKIKYADGSFPFKDLVDNLAEDIKKSLLFREFENSKDEKRNFDTLWEQIFNSIIITNLSLNEKFTQLPNYSLSGVERMKEMMEETFKNFYSTRDNLDDALATLNKSMQKARELYMRLLLLPVELTQLRLNQLEENKNKHLPTVEDLNPNMRFVDNCLPELISSNQIFTDYIEKNKISWIAEEKSLLEELLKNILSSEIYQDYINEKEVNSHIDIEFWREVFKKLIFNNEYFLEYLENKSVFWNDDIEITGTFLLKSFKRFEEPTTITTAVLPMYKDKEDAEFGASLFKDVMDHKDLYRKYIETSLSNERWEADRLAFMDIVITMTAIAEIINYPKIPLIVSINEYIEIAKSYSSSKSGAFINGLLASIIQRLREEDKIKK